VFTLFSEAYYFGIDWRQQTHSIFFIYLFFWFMVFRMNCVNAPFKIFSDVVNCDYIILLTANTSCQCCHTTSCRSHMSSNQTVGIIIQKLDVSSCVVTAVNGDARGDALVNLLFLLLNYYSIIFRIIFVLKLIIFDCYCY